MGFLLDVLGWFLLTAQIFVQTFSGTTTNRELPRSAGQTPLHIPKIAPICPSPGTRQTKTRIVPLYPHTYTMIYACD
ncbi:hypothetical protein EDB19DRAFT_1743100 [Suillus lakei]|nr:hypothetical protein EDB19DRAFT_1743100 [Suillus lakei]